jgi:hypothetical protein
MSVKMAWMGWPALWSRPKLILPFVGTIALYVIGHNSAWGHLRADQPGSKEAPATG